MFKKRKIARQSWEPHVLLRALQSVLGAVVSVLKLALGALATVAFIGIICCFALIDTAGDYLQNDVIPSVTFDLGDYELDQTSFIYYVDAFGNIQKQQKIYADTDRQWASFDQIPEDMIHAAVAIEDKRFYEHQGVDWITTVKACANMFFGNSSSFGGSTITQQLIKNLTTEDSITVQRKVQEIFKAYEFESKYDKDVVMEWYLNTIYLGQGCAGVRSAARTYFGKDLEDLTTAECASIISITNNPSLYDPYIRPENNRKRQLTVLDQMLDQGWITEEEHDEAVAQEMVFTSESQEEQEIYTCPNCGFEGEDDDYTLEDETYYCPDCQNKMDIEFDESSDMYSWHTELVLDDVARGLAEKYGMVWDDTTKKTCLNMIKKGGYHIYSTFDENVQEVVDEIYTDLSQIPTTRSSQQLQSAIVVIDNRTGDVVALAGRVGEKDAFDAFSFAYDGGLQTGSVMKPLTVYAPAFELGVISPASVIPDAPFDTSDGNFPQNESRTYGGSATVLSGIARSLNTTAVHVLDKIGTSYSFDIAKNKFGLKGLLDNEVTASGKTLSDVDYAPLALGALTYGVTVRDMANAYATFPNDGVYREARTYTKVYDSEGNLILDNTQDSWRAISEKANNYMNYCLRTVVTSGTGTYANFGSTMVCAKTGTTSNNQDRWFIGYTHYYTAAVWCGYAQPEQVVLTGDGTNPAGRLWVKVMSQLHKEVEWVDLYSSSGMYGVSVCLDSGKGATAACSADPRGDRVASALVYSGDGPEGTCTSHVMVDYCVAGQGVCNEFCKQVPGNEITSRSLLKCTTQEITGKYKYSGLTDDVIYLVDGSGNPANFYGIDGNINKGVTAPYKVCTLHNAESLKPVLPEPILPGIDPTDPTAPTESHAETTP